MQEDSLQDRCKQDSAIRHNFRVKYLENEKILNNRIYESLSELTADAFALFENHTFNKDNAIITYIDDINGETLLTCIPTTDQHMHLYVKHVRILCIFKVY